jgi:CBS domain-containing protein
MKASDIMTRRIISVHPEDSILQAARLMLQNRISGLPVVDDQGKLVGLVSEGDLLRRIETGTQRKRPGWLEFLVGPGELAQEYVRSSGRKIEEVMTRELYTVSEEAPLGEIVQMMERRRIKRVPVLRDGKLVGIVSRGNLLHAFATVAHEVKPAAQDDAGLREQLLAHLEKQSWAPIATINVVVRNGVVDLWGTITDEREREALIVAAQNVPGVKKVRDNLTWVDATTGIVFGPPQTGSQRQNS